MTDQNKIKIGITGHLSLQKNEVIEKSILQILKRIIHEHPNELAGFYSPLSPGADLLAAKIADECSIPLYVILPYNVDEYLQHFSNEDQILFQQLYNRSEESISLSDKKQENIYETLGDYLVKNMDILIAIWNGQEARGPGGTGDVVREFRQTGKPLAWVRADNMVADQPVFLPDSLQFGTIQYENW